MNCPKFRNKFFATTSFTITKMFVYVLMYFDWHKNVIDKKNLINVVSAIHRRPYPSWKENRFPFLRKTASFHLETPSWSNTIVISKDKNNEDGSLAEVEA